MTFNCEFTITRWMLENMNVKNTNTSMAQNLNRITIILLILMIIEGFIGNYITSFSTFPNGTVPSTITGFIDAINSAGIAVLIHYLIGILILLLGIVIVILAFYLSESRNVKITSILGIILLMYTFLTGILFVFSGFQDNSFSVGMGEGYILAYTLYFMVLYYCKK